MQRFQETLILGLRVADMTADCCGIVGTYGLKKEKYQIAMDVGRRLFDNIKASNGDLVACDNETCRWQIEPRHRNPIGASDPPARPGLWDNLRAKEVWG